ncbi:MAG TPA: hypothetical protein VKZ81_18760 [Pseudonocardia sp.]|uniref:RCC1 domain-containing protein n=1 Tax=Pseudonocardia sp. TaxID=60912 RepID=UPI002B4B3BA0|nr:hypothetical protein [Pseudonocardia sp.]HLU57501.1 hypothetical protein [Pseudonocardia sp.]
MRSPSALRAVLAVSVSALLGLVGCTPADRAVLGAPECRDVPGGPSSDRAVPGTVYAWRPPFTTADSPTPTFGENGPEPVPGWTDVVSIASTGHTAFAVRADGTVEGYGLGFHGSLGDGDLGRHIAMAPQPVPGITDARSVHAVGDAAFVVRADGTVLAWGQGLLANGGAVNSGRDHVAQPVPLDGLRDVHAIAEGDLTALALRTDGRVAGWGINVTAQLGDRDGTALTTVRGVSGVVSLAAAGGAVVAARGDGSVCAWGNNAFGLLAVTPLGGQTGRPRAIAGLADVVQVAGANHAAFALDRHGGVWAWGRGGNGLLADGREDDHVSAVPTRIEGLPPARWIGAGRGTAVAIDRDGGLWTWGIQLSSARSPRAYHAVRPERVPLPGPVLAVSGNHALIAPSGVAL